MGTERERERQRQRQRERDKKGERQKEREKAWILAQVQRPVQSACARCLITQFLYGFWPVYAPRAGEKLSHPRFLRHRPVQAERRVPRSARKSLACAVFWAGQFSPAAKKPRHGCRRLRLQDNARIRPGFVCSCNVSKVAPARGRCISPQLRVQALRG